MEVVSIHFKFYTFPLFASPKRTAESAKRFIVVLTNKISLPRSFSDLYL